jgi:hypothetical protein
MLSILHDQVVDAIMSENQDLLHQCVRDGLCDVLTSYRTIHDTLIREEGWTPLMFACFEEKPIAVKILLEIEGPFAEYSGRGISELNILVRKLIRERQFRNLDQVHEIIALIFQNGIDVTRLEDDFHSYIRDSQRIVVRAFLRNSHFFRHPSNFARHPFTNLAEVRWHPIHTFETLMTCTHVHEADKNGRTALFVIAHRVNLIGTNAFYMIQRLLGCGVNPNVRDPDTNLTPFSTVVRFRRFMRAEIATLRLQIASLLIASGAEFEVPDPIETHPQTMPRESSWYEKVYAIDPRRPLAIACAWHPRLGHASEIQRLPTELHRAIHNMAFEEYNRMLDRS